ncbi:MAG TPA: PadR family transcriptional regulator [Thermomicrobiales bacterium]|nr:PadR family transcriptional regulator [Thermomicrobiales bacterium]
MARKRPSNPLALAVLASLYERPMHPYEMASMMRSRGKDASIKLNYGSLYTVVETLERRGLIAPHETQREGRRPERTVYGLTDAGRIMLIDWLSELISTPVKEYTQFEAALSFLGVLPPDEVATLLREREGHLDVEIRQLRAVLEMTVERQIPRLFTVEGEYWLMLREAERAWVSQLAGEIERGELASLDLWRELHAQIAAGQPISYPEGGVIEDD